MKLRLATRWQQRQGGYRTAARSLADDRLRTVIPTRRYSAIHVPTLSTR